MKPSQRDPRGQRPHHEHRGEERDPRYVNRPESYAGYADSGDDDYPAAQQDSTRGYSGHAHPRPSGEQPGDPARYARGYSRDHAAGWGQDGPQPGEEQHYRGHGPRRSPPGDEDMLDTICERLAGDSDMDASEIEVSVRDGRVVLAGMVPSRQARRDAEAIAESVRGVREVDNRLKVESKDTQPF